jgi:predicted SprT family Zn-dependent metalloprotease
VRKKMFQVRVNELMTVAAEKYPNTVFKPVTAKNTLKGLVAGHCLPNGIEVDFNQEAANKYPEEFDLTVIHEVAHAVDLQINGYRRSSNGKGIHHDDVFYNICRKLGDSDPTRTHNYKLTPTKIFREFIYRDTEGKERILKTRSHNDLQKGKQEWYKWKGGAKVFKDTFVKEIPRAEILARYVISDE